MRGEGFSANGLNCGLNPVKEKNDLGLISVKSVQRGGSVYPEQSKGSADSCYQKESCRYGK